MQWQCGTFSAGCDRLQFQGSLSERTAPSLPLLFEVSYLISACLRLHSTKLHPGNACPIFLSCLSIKYLIVCFVPAPISALLSLL